MQLRMPPHRLTVHAYADAPADRFVILNSRKLREGGRTPEGLLLHAIRADGVVLEFEGTRFFLPR
jgi:general secretion pathway protein B